ncbi:MAG: Holliday junction branch migration protein RuvA [Bryobacterales bacterium]|nr:Holliday junction branch migration protein RuvA [Bryobacterales bacterium]
MIAHLRGTVLEKHPNQVIVDAHGVGYDVTIPVSTYSTLPDAGEPVTLRIYTHVREDIIALFGFAKPEEKVLFEKLIGVSGIGPKLAITVLSGLAAADLVQYIRSGAVEKLVRIPGIGKKTAERMVLELRDKLDGVTLAEKSAAAAAASTPAAPVLDEMSQDAVSALVNLGAQRAQADAAVRKARAANPEANFETLFRKAMENLR